MLYEVVTCYIAAATGHASYVEQLSPPGPAELLKHAITLLVSSDDN
jgi:hypothetical protein